MLIELIYILTVHEEQTIAKTGKQIHFLNELEVLTVQVYDANKFWREPARFNVIWGTVWPLKIFIL